MEAFIRGGAVAAALENAKAVCAIMGNSLSKRCIDGNLTNLFIWSLEIHVLLCSEGILRRERDSTESDWLQHRHTADFNEPPSFITVLNKAFIETCLG